MNWNWIEMEFKNILSIGSIRLRNLPSIQYWVELKNKKQITRPASKFVFYAVELFYLPTFKEKNLNIYISILNKKSYYYKYWKLPKYLNVIVKHNNGSPWLQFEIFRSILLFTFIVYCIIKKRYAIRYFHYPIIEQHKLLR